MTFAFPRRRSPYRMLSVALGACLLAGAAAADVVVLKSGVKVEGKIVAETADSVKIRTKISEISIERSKIDKITKSKLPEEEVEARVKAAGNDAAKMWEAALLAKSSKLNKRYQELVARTLELDPQHNHANESAGNTLYEGSWYTAEALEKHKAEQAEKMKAEGMELFEGEWVKRHVAMIRRNFEEYEGEWLTKAEVYRRKAAKLLPELVGVTLRIDESPHVMLHSDLPPEEAAELLDMLESGYEHFVSTFEPDERERKIIDEAPTAVYFFPDSKLIEKFVAEGGYMRQVYNPPKGSHERFADATNFVIFFPRALIVMSPGRHMQGGTSSISSLRGFFAQFYGDILIRRFKRGGRVTGWIESGIAHYYETRLNNYRTTTMVEYAGFEHVNVWVEGLSHFEKWYQAARDPAFRASLPALRALTDKPVEELDGLARIKAYFLVKYLLENDKARFVDFTRQAWLTNSDTRVTTTEAEAFERIFGNPDDLDSKFNEWLAAQPDVPAPF